MPGYTKSTDGIFRPMFSIEHRSDEYQESGFEVLRAMQESHFWYQGRHRFLLSAVNHHIPRSPHSLSAIDLGGGIGGWLNYFFRHQSKIKLSLALGDSSLVALKMAALVLPQSTQRYQVDLMKLDMNEKWDCIFLLDVIEHLPYDLQVFDQVYEALKPGGYLFVTAPAFPQFWSYNDDMALHLRRYRRNDFVKLAQNSGMIMCDARYFMFYLSPLYLFSRMNTGFENMTIVQKKELLIRQHQIPHPLINKVLSVIFSAETPIGHWIKFPWGTSILGVFKKP